MNGGIKGLRCLAVAAIAAVACGALLWAWFALGSDHVDDPPDLVVAVAAVVGGIVWAEGKRREKMRLIPLRVVAARDCCAPIGAALLSTPSVSPPAAGHMPPQRNGGAPATPMRPGRGTDRDIPASFPRSRSSRIVFSPKPKLAAVARETNEKDAFPGPPVCGIKDSAGGSEGPMAPDWRGCSLAVCI